MPGDKKINEKRKRSKASPDSDVSMHDNFPDFVSIHDSNGQYSYVSPVVTSVLGYDSEELIGKSPLDYIHPDDRDRMLKDSYIVSIFGDSKSIEYRFRKKDGSYIWFETLTSVVKDSDGKAIKFHASSRDISARKEEERKLVESEMMYRTHFKSLPIPSFTWKRVGDDFIFSDFNDEALKVTGKDIYKQLGKSAGEIFKNRPDISDNIRRCYDEKKVITTEASFDMKKGVGSKTVIGSYIFVPPAMVVVHTEDITEKKLREEEIRNLAKFPEDNPNPVFRVSAANRVIYSNAASRWIIDNWNTEEGREVPEFVISAADFVNKKNYTLTKEVSVKGRIFHFTITPVSGVDEVYFYGLDITDRKVAEEELLLIRKVFETTSEGIVVTDSQNNIIRINPAFTEITGYSAEEVIGKNPRILKSDRHDEIFYRGMWSALMDNGTWEGEIWNRRKSGETYPEWLSINVIFDELRNVKNYVSVFRDISDIKSSEERIEYQAYHDPLTGLPNRALFSDRLSLAVNQAVRNGSQMALLYIDLDRFKIINDSLGHITGDYLLQEVAGRLAECVRDGDTVARIGGDEFVIIIPHIDEISDVVKVCERISDKFSVPVKIESNELFISASIGISISPDDGTTVAELHKNADIAMYHAKGLGGGEYQFFSIEMNSEIDVRLMLEMQLRKALENDQFDIFFQPIVDSRTGNTAGIEALSRWIHPEFGIIPPSTFIPVAEETGYIVQINDLILRKACIKCRQIIDSGHPGIYVSVNVTSHQFVNRRILESVSSALDESEISPENLIIEITEDSIMQNVEEINSIMKELKVKGIKFSIDDFGTGYSSLSYLKKFPIDNLKIDRSFIVDIPVDNDSRTLARTIIVLARELGLKIIAEGVDKQEQVDFFSTNNEFLIQGFYYSKPLPYDDLLLFLKNHPTFPGKKNPD